MLSKHFENVRQKSENYRMLYAFSVSVLFTAVVAGFWVFSFFIPNMSNASNSASVAGAIDGVNNGVNNETNNISPTAVVKQEAGNVFDSFFDSIKSIANKSFMGGQYKVQFDNGTLGLSQNNGSDSSLSVNSENGGVNGGANNGTFSTTTASGITVEAEQVNSSLGADGSIIVPDENGNVGASAVN